MAVDTFALESLVRLRSCLQSRDILCLKSLAGEFAAQALEREEPHYVDMTIIAYSFAKLLEKHYVIEAPEFRALYRRTLTLLEEAREGVEKGRVEEQHAKVASLTRELEGLHKSLGRFVISVVEKARIKAATQMYAHGASLSKAASLARASKREVASYIGATHLPEKYRTLPVKRRLDLAEQFFGEA
jgi:hypothetical protein